MVEVLQLCWAWSIYSRQHRMFITHFGSPPIIGRQELFVSKLCSWAFSSLDACLRLDMVQLQAYLAHGLFFLVHDIQLKAVVNQE